MIFFLMRAPPPEFTPCVSSAASDVYKGQDILVTGHGMRSITGVEVGIDLNTATEKQFQAIPGIGDKSAWKLVSTRAKEARDGGEFSSVEEAFELAGVEIPELAAAVLEVRE